MRTAGLTWESWGLAADDEWPSLIGSQGGRPTVFVDFYPPENSRTATATGEVAGFRMRWGRVDAPTWEVLGALARDDHNNLVVARFAIQPLIDENQAGVPPLPTGGVTGQALRAVPLAAIDYALRAMTEGRYLADDEPGWLHEPGHNPQSSASPRGRGRPKRSPERLRLVAEAYLRLLKCPEPIYPGLVALFPDLTTEETARSWVKAAKDEGWLRPGRRGTRAGKPGPRLLDAWDDEHGSRGRKTSLTAGERAMQRKGRNRHGQASAQR